MKGQGLEGGFGGTFSYLKSWHPPAAPFRSLDPMVPKTPSTVHRFRPFRQLNRRCWRLRKARHRTVESRSPSPSNSDTDTQLASRYPPPSPFIGAITPSSDTATVRAVSATSSVSSRPRASTCGRCASQRAENALGNQTSELFEAVMLPNAANTSSASRGTRCAVSIAPGHAACGACTLRRYPPGIPSQRPQVRRCRPGLWCIRVISA